MKTEEVESIARRTLAPDRNSLSPVHFAAATVMLAVAAFCEFALGRQPWGNDGPGLWSGDIWSSHNSQYIADPYTFSHISHGILLYLLGRSIFRRASGGAIFLAVVAVECLWEVIENTSFVINRYRSETISLNYYGDSIFNSMFDIVACVIGVLIARALPWRYALVLLVALELSLAFAIHDSLFLNLIMLIHPIPALKHWQAPK